MSSEQQVGNFVIISPVKDEERYVETTIHAVLRQTVRPKKWIIVDDGSHDRTVEIVTSFSDQFEWISLVRVERDATRQPGSGVIRAFDFGYQTVPPGGCEFIVKLDCDVDLPANYFESLLAKFRADERLGIASGIFMEKTNERWHPVKMPNYHAAGASKMIRTKCFEGIGGFVRARGWDTVDEIRAHNLGWHTKHFKELNFRHLKPEGIGIGYLRTNAMHGEIYYLVGGGPFFFSLKVIHRCLFGKPFLIGGIILAAGYLKAWLTKKAKLVTKIEADSYRRLLNSRVMERLAALSLWQR
jgi:glycosyltransferase involved in cell wall biosynthesis